MCSAANERQTVKIPKRFKLFGQTIDVEFDPMLNSDKDWNGEASYRTSKIVLQPDSPQTPRNSAQIGQTFCHELIHHILYAANAKKEDKWLHQDEVLVDLMGSLLHQALTTFSFDD